MTGQPAANRLLAVRRLRRLAGALGLLGGLLARTATAQFLESDDVPRVRTIPEKQEVDDDMSRSKLRLGPVRLLPAVAVTDAGYESNVFSTSSNPEADWTATISLGARLLLPMGSKVFLVSNLFPQYTWYANLSDRNRWGGVYDASLLGFFNRLSFELTGSDRRQYTLYSSELPSYVFSETAKGVGKVEVDLTRSLALFAAGGYEQVRYTQYSGPPIQDAQVKLNNSDDSEVRGGLRFQFGEEWSASVAAEEVRSIFVYEPDLRNNQSIAYLGGIFYSRPRLFINATGGYREGKSYNGSIYPEYQTGVGSYFVSFYPLRWLELQTYGHRRVQYSINILQPYYFDNKIAVAANIELLDHVLVKGYVEDGPNTYPEAQPVPGEGFVKRVDHVKYYGGGLSIRLPAKVVLTGLITRQVYVSNIPEDSRNFWRFTAFLNFTGVYSR